MDNREEFGYELEGNIAYKNYGQPKNDPIKAAYLEDLAAEDARKRAESDKKWAEMEKTDREYRKNLEDWNEKSPGQHLYTFFNTRATYLLKNSTSERDIELAKKMNSCILEDGKIVDLSAVEEVFITLREIAKTDEIIADALPSWEAEFNKARSILSSQQAKKEKPKKEAYGRVKLITKIIAKIKGTKPQTIEEENIEKEGKSR